MSKPKRRQYTDEYKREAVKLCHSGTPVARVARELDMDASLLRQWVKLQREASTQPEESLPVAPESISDVQRLRSELRKVTMERDILKKALAYLARDPQ